MTVRFTMTSTKRDDLRFKDYYPWHSLHRIRKNWNLGVTDFVRDLKLSTSYLQEPGFYLFIDNVPIYQLTYVLTTH